MTAQRLLAAQSWRGTHPPAQLLASLTDKAEEGNGSTESNGERTRSAHHSSKKDLRSRFESLGEETGNEG